MASTLDRLSNQECGVLYLRRLLPETSCNHALVIGVAEPHRRPREALRCDVRPVLEGSQDHTQARSSRRRSCVGIGFATGGSSGAPRRAAVWVTS